MARLRQNSRLKGASKKKPGLPHTKRGKQILRILAQKDGSSINNGGMTQFMVARYLFGSLSGRDMFFGVFAVRAYLDGLEEQGLVTRRKQGPQHVYRTNVS